MFHRFCLLAALLSLLVPGALAQDDNPTVAILRLGPLPNYEIIEGGILDVLESYGYITEEDNRILEGRVDHAAAGVNIIWGDAGFELAPANLMIEQALDADADALVTIGAQVTLAAVVATQDMDSPTPIIFTAVSEPYGVGIAESDCDKPANVVGSRNTPSYQYALVALQLQNPDISKVGTIFSAGEAGGAFGAAELATYGAELGIEVLPSAAVGLADLRLSTYSLIENGAQAIILTTDSLTTQGLPIITAIANEVGVPVFYPSFSAIYYGATIGAGASAFYAHGTNAGRLLTAHLHGELDFANTGIATAGYLGIGINLDSAEAQGVEISEEMMGESIVVWDGGRTTKLAPGILAAIARRGVVIPLEERQEEDAAWLDSLQCAE